MVEKMIGKTTTTDDILTQAGKHMLDDAYAGTFAADEVPEKPFTYAIVNLDRRTEGGSHWIALAQVEKGTYMVYDSFGRHTGKIIPSLQLKTIDTEHDAEQSVSQKNCGARCLAWLLLFDSFGPEAAQTI
jgi:hypothetical protein